ncbi:Dehydration-responsive element-binding protein 1F [Hibiscus syriacus]|uniref:Dehydration-responsive element-binding protein 1F n=1 Tax=Hibiscus syriacus TaxID=106335 RepID=A0A6A2Y5W8_HIBSY|nr:dehydration-responsive element-binding protein 1B-like [Hibiscus syriacus]KAE8671556.1 Dehydration-responsive element-binding protein 1F [Hibiscus syriacus]
MDDPSQTSETLKSYPMRAERVEPYSSSETGIGSRAVHSDEEVLLLATNRPKKRAGRRVFKETRHPVFRGVRRRNNDKWVCELREPNTKTRIWLGTYPTPEMAARAHDVAALAFRGKSACLNFADSVWRLPVPASNDAADIRRAAAEAAEALRPQEFQELSGSYARQGSLKASDSEVSSSDVNKKKRAAESELSTEKVQFVDEEEVFYMPKLLDSMAEGLLLSPPRNHDDADSDFDVSLWSYSI